MRIFKIYSPSNIQGYITVLLTIIIMLYIRRDDNKDSDGNGEGGDGGAINGNCSDVGVISRDDSVWGFLSFLYLIF